MNKDEMDFRDLGASEMKVTILEMIVEKFPGNPVATDIASSIERLERKPKDWRIGLSVKVKMRNHALYYEPPHTIINAFPSGYGGLVDKDGVLQLRSASGDVYLQRSQDWMTA